jgi:hypothetical protein
MMRVSNTSLGPTDMESSKPPPSRGFVNTITGVQLWAPQAGLLATSDTGPSTAWASASHCVRQGIKLEQQITVP